MEQNCKAISGSPSAPSPMAPDRAAIIQSLTSKVKTLFIELDELRARSTKYLNKMDSKMMKLKMQLDKITKFLDPYLPLMNCHMVEFITDGHWYNLTPKNLRCSLEKYDIRQAVDLFFNIANSNMQAKDVQNHILYDFIQTAKSHRLKIDGQFCLSLQQFQEKIVLWGGRLKPEIKIKEFMTDKKSYEVKTMAPLVAALQDVCMTTHCVDAGGGRGYLPIVLDLGYSVPSLAVDCDEIALKSGQRRNRLIVKRWPSIAKDTNLMFDRTVSNGTLHKFVHTFITKDTRLGEIVKENFPEHSMDDVKLLLTGMHTCGNLGPSCIRAFLSQSEITAIFNVPCCYHLLSEQIDGQLWDVFERNYNIGSVPDFGFPMSQYLTGYQLGRNARMLASQSIDRVVNLRQIPSDNLFYRALLQVIIKTHLPHKAIPERRLKRLTKCQSFEEYFKMADAALNLSLYDNVGSGYLTDLHAKYEKEHYNLVLFYLLRLCFAQVVESVILLDRLLFLFENGFENAFLVALFDPTLSPRCHGVVALK
ncbi:Methyltransferase-like protein 25 [Eumeta japonica]|uniref:Methyltransferase-like protein 25 n=1 Tax=Eumeta variegata TaxID=151549 RepID=A0A4C1YJ00_EUMVA|nr:Methyltransferase-like protein 25 [Eumeta japonica]